MEKENITFLWAGRVSKARRILSENGRPEIFAENRRFLAENKRFPAKTGGLESWCRPGFNSKSVKHSFLL